jgi:hypothetical protein
MDIPLTAGLGAANAAVGVAVDQALRALFRLRPRGASTEGSSRP